MNCACLPFAYARSTGSFKGIMGESKEGGLGAGLMLKLTLGLKPCLEVHGI